MLECFRKIDGKKTGIFAAGVLFGTAGIKILASKDAKKLYTNCTAAVLRAKECVMKTAATIQENAEDIYAEAQQMNEERAEAACGCPHRQTIRPFHRIRGRRSDAPGYAQYPPDPDEEVLYEFRWGS